MLVRTTIGLFAISVSAGAIAAPCAGFVDVDDSNATYCSAVTYVKNKGITLGCTDASHYCPNADVTRLQMALFLQRTGKGNAANTLVDSTATIGGGGASGTQVALPSLGTQDCTSPPGGPCANRVTDMFGTVAGGIANQAGDASGAIDTAPYATVGGGFGNTASGTASTVSGGNGNVANGPQSFVGGGEDNNAGGILSTVSGGATNIAGGSYATVPGGLGNQALGLGSFAAGMKAVVTHDNSFLWCDGHTTCNSQEAQDFIVVAQGGIKIYALTGGCTLTGAATQWSCFSDRAVKENFVPPDTSEVLMRVIELPVTRWNEKGVPGVEHMGPMAQDFHAAFGLGADDKHIGSADISGVALAAIQGLNAKLEAQLAEKELQLLAQQREIAELRERLTQVESLRGELAALRNAVTGLTKAATIAAQADATAP